MLLILQFEVIRIKIILNRRDLGHRENHISFTGVESSELPYEKNFKLV